MQSAVHPALAFCPIIPFLPSTIRLKQKELSDTEKELTKIDDGKHTPQTATRTMHSLDRPPCGTN